jgi:hypothetical protein
MILAALVLPAVLGFSALAVEGGLWYADHHQLRNLADTAAIAAGWARKEGQDEYGAAMAAVSDIGFNPDTDELEWISPPEAGNYAGDTQSIAIVIHRQRSVLLARLFMDSSAMEISARSVTHVGVGAGLCLLALRDTGTGYTSSGGASVDLEHCGMQVNSTSNGAVTMSGGAKIDAEWVHVGGTITKSGGAAVVTDDLKTGAPAAPDPFASLSFPGAGTCNFNNLSYSGGATATLNPGRYCNGISLSGSAKVTLNPGTYIIDKGSLSLSGGTTLTATSGVTIVLTGSGSNWASATFSGGSTVTLNAPTSGAYAGMAIIKDRAATSGTISLSGGVGMKINGAVYSPAQSLTYSGGTGMSTGCTQIVAYSFTMSGGSRLSGDCTGFSLPKIDGSDPPSLVE